MKVLQSITLLSLFIMLPLISFAQSTSNNDEQEVLSVLDDFMSSFSGSDPVVTAHIRIFDNLSDTDWHHSEWVEREIINITDTKAHVATRVRRFRDDGSEIVTFESLYILIKVEERWGIKFRSSFL